MLTPLDTVKGGAPKGPLAVAALSYWEELVVFEVDRGKFAHAHRGDPWSTALGNIPWSEPGFSQRMLAEHLNQAHDGASRTQAGIVRQVSWIHKHLLAQQPARILDLGCGPGLYATRFAALGHSCVGLDMGPASIEYARNVASRDQLDCSYTLGDLRTQPFGEDFDLVFFSYGEPSVFSPPQLDDILRRAFACLKPGGVLLLEPHTEAGVRALGGHEATTKTLSSGLFLDRPHFLRVESSYDEPTQVGARHYLVCESSEHPVEVHSVWYQAYSDEALRARIADAGFEAASVAFHPNGVDTHDPPHLQFVSARREAHSAGC